MKQLMRGVLTGAGLGAVMLTASLAAQGPVRVEMKDAQGQSIGTASLSEMSGMVHIQLDVKGLKPGEHALHVRHAERRAEARHPLVQRRAPHIARRKRLRTFESVF